MRSWKRRALLPGLALLLAACGAPTPPEQRVRGFVAGAEQLVEERKYVELVDLIAADYLDTHGNDRLKAAAALRGLFLRHKSIHLLTRIDSIALPSPDHAVVTLYIAMAQRPFADGAMPDADIFRLELDLIADGDSYEVLQSRWQRAGAADLVF